MPAKIENLPDAVRVQIFRGSDGKNRLTFWDVNHPASSVIVDISDDGVRALQTWVWTHFGRRWEGPK